MIRGMHAMLYSSKADALRTFIKEKLRLPSTDVGEGWLIFDVAEADLGVHPTEENGYFQVPGAFTVQLYQPRYTK